MSESFDLQPCVNHFRNTTTNCHGIVVIVMGIRHVYREAPADFDSEFNLSAQNDGSFNGKPQATAFSLILAIPLCETQSPAACR